MRFQRNSMLAIVFLGAALTSTSVPVTAENGGKYIGKLSVDLLGDGLKIKLRTKYGYRDPTGKDWMVPKGYVADGASIPWIAWSAVGGPLSGKYRNASVIHDYYCDKKNRPWKDVHRMFDDAMATSGVPGVRRGVMYYAVYQWGPRWEKGRRSVRTCARKQDSKCLEWKTLEKEELIVTMPKFDRAQFEEIQALLKTKDMSREEIEKLADKKMRAKVLDEIK